MQVCLSSKIARFKPTKKNIQKPFKENHFIHTGRWFADNNRVKTCDDVRGDCID